MSEAIEELKRRIADNFKTADAASLLLLVGQAYSLGHRDGFQQANDVHLKSTEMLFGSLNKSIHINEKELTWKQ